MKHRSRECSHTDCHHHIAELTDGRIRKHRLEPPLRDGNDRGKECCKGTQPCNKIHHHGRFTKDKEGARDEKNTRCDHRRRMDEC